MSYRAGIVLHPGWGMSLCGVRWSGVTALMLENAALRALAWLTSSGLARGRGVGMAEHSALRYPHPSR